MGRLIRYILPAALTFGLGFFTGQGHNPAGVDRTTETRTTQASDYSRPESSTENNDTRQPILRSQSSSGSSDSDKIRGVLEKQRTLEEKISAFEKENETLKEKLSEIRRKTGIYDFSNLPKPEGKTLKEKFKSSPAYFLGNMDLTYEDMIKMVREALEHSEGLERRRYSSRLDFYDFGIMDVTKLAQPGNWFVYTVDIYLNGGITNVEPFNEVTHVDISIAKDPMEGNVKKEEMIVLKVGVIRDQDSDYNHRFGMEAVYDYKTGRKLFERVRKNQYEDDEETSYDSFGGSSAGAVKDLESIMFEMDNVIK